MDNQGQNSVREAIILAGGFGTRLQPAVSDLPKPMAPVAGRPFLEYLLDHLIRQKITNVVLSVGYKAKIIIEHFRDSYNGLSIKYCVEEAPLGTGGAIRQSLKMVSQKDVIVLNGDSFFDIDYDQLLSAHREKKADITIAFKPMKNFDRYGSVTLEKSRIVTFEEKKARSSGFINGGVYVIRRDLFNGVLSLPRKFSFEQDFLMRFVHDYMIAGHLCDGYFVDVGTPNDYNSAQNELAKYS
ncbi:MAG: nucleotidyltransferase family protein [Deltaproteobacteria bacterium]|nr:nucleotidyltransferase family protein [Deltaproteobacteria bacterium]